MSNSIPWLPATPETFPAGQGAFEATNLQGNPLSEAGTDKAAVTAFVFGLSGLIIPFVPPVVALFLGIGAKRNIRSPELHLKGTGIANAAIILGAVMLGINVLITLALFL